jgi:hypothetical protein
MTSDRDVPRADLAPSQHGFAKALTTSAEDAQRHLLPVDRNELNALSDGFAFPVA